jgi:hypothetical protein
MLESQFDPTVASHEHSAQRKGITTPESMLTRRTDNKFHSQLVSYRQSEIGKQQERTERTEMMIQDGNYHCNRQFPEIKEHKETESDQKANID